MGLTRSKAEMNRHMSHVSQVYTLDFHLTSLDVRHPGSALHSMQALCCFGDCKTVKVVLSLVCTHGTVTHWHFCELLASHRDERANRNYFSTAALFSHRRPWIRHNSIAHSLTLQCLPSSTVELFNHELHPARSVLSLLQGSSNPVLLCHWAHLWRSASVLAGSL